MVGIGMAFGTVLSLFAFVLLENNRNRIRFNIFIGVKLLIAMILIIAGLASLEKDRISGGLIGAGSGLFFGSVVSSMLFYNQCWK